MALIVTTLVDDILKVIDKDNPDFVGFPIVRIGVPPFYDRTATNNLVAHNWGEAILPYFSAISVPAVLVTIFPAAQAAFESAMAAILNAPGPLSDTLAMLAFGAGLDAFAASLVTGLLPTPPGVALPPPPGTFHFTPSLPPPGTSGSVAASTAATNMADAIDIWAKTGTFTPTSGTPIPWL